jgi:hypothetical protein
MLLPIKLILFQIIFLLLTIAIEAYILYSNLEIPRQISIRYAIVINLYSTAIGWFFIFLLQGRMPENIKLNIINYLIFGNLSNNWKIWENNIIYLVIGFLLILITCYLEFKLLLILQAILSSSKATLTVKDSHNLNLYYRLHQAILRNDVTRLLTIIKANLFSYIGVRIVVFLILKLR